VKVAVTLFGIDVSQDDDNGSDPGDSSSERQPAGFTRDDLPLFHFVEPFTD
jgi:hypothetical protein